MFGTAGSVLIREVPSIQGVLYREVLLCWLHSCMQHALHNKHSCIKIVYHAGAIEQNLGVTLQTFKEPVEGPTTAVAPSVFGPISVVY